ncbi:MAG: cytochrome b5 domain-containing protein [bacterium]
MSKEFTYAELQQFNGEKGQPVYIAHNNIVYDVSESDLWKTGRHQNLHDGGEELTNELTRAPHGEEVFERFPKVGVLK